jgi:hypothetical protein
LLKRFSICHFRKIIGAFTEVLIKKLALPFNIMSSVRAVPGINVMILKIFLPKKIGETLGTFDSKYSNLRRKVVVALVFKKIANFCRKMVKIAENCDHNIDLLSELI